MAHEFDGRKYEKASTHQKEWGIKLIKELGLRGTERVLDLGCGDGTITMKIAELVPAGKVVGIDASQGMIETALPKATGNVQFLIMDINNFIFDEQFDVVYSNASLHWVKEHKSLLDNVHQILRPGGIARFNFAGNGNCSHFIKIIREAMALGQFAECLATFEWPWYMPSVNEYESLIEASELNDALVWEENADRYFQNETALIQWLDQPSLVPFIAHIHGQIKYQFRNYVVKRMIEETKQSDGRCFETFRRINVWAKKAKKA